MELGNNLRVISKGRSTWIDFFSDDNEFSMVEVFGFSKKTSGSCQKTSGSYHESSTVEFLVFQIKLFDPTMTPKSPFYQIEMMV